MGPQEFARQANVSRETFERLEIYAATLAKWNPRINLVAKSTLGDLWTRHFFDSAQVFDIAPPGRRWVDLGSGGGFPGLVIAAIAVEKRPELRVTLVESDQRKSMFLRTVAREMGVEVQVIAKRIEDIPALEADILSARALAPLDHLLSFADRHLAPEGVALFPKGENADKEIEESLASWRFVAEKFNSKTDSNAVILKIGGIERV